MWRESSNMNLSATKDVWDLRAKEFNGKDKNARMDEVIEFLLSKNIVNKSSEILDIGCGPGKYSVEFSKKSKYVTGIDISPNMIKYARENAEKLNIRNISFDAVPWQHIDLNQRAWNNRFDLVFASMSPAIDSKDTLVKMNEASKGYCFLSGFVTREDEVRDTINRLSSKGKYINNWGIKMYCAFNILWQLGIYPEIYYRDVQWENKRRLEDAINVYTVHIKEEPQIVYDIKNYLNSISKDGIIVENTKAKIGWMIWRV